MEFSQSRFNVVKDCLDEMYAKIDAYDDQERDQLILSELKRLSDCYGKGRLDKEQTGIDYSRQETRFAYMYTYVAAHSGIVYDIVTSNSDLENIFIKDEVRVSSIGIGPGSDLIGIHKYWKEQGERFRLLVSLHDKETAWNGSWPFLDKSIKIQQFDVTSKPLVTSEKLYQADLITMVYFLSEVYAKKDAATDFFYDLFENMKSGATILFIDNGGYDFAPWFDDLIYKYSFDIRRRDNYVFKIGNIGTRENKEHLGNYDDKFVTNQPEGNKRYPKLGATISYRICCKR